MQVSTRWRAQYGEMGYEIRRVDGKHGGRWTGPMVGDGDNKHVGTMVEVIVKCYNDQLKPSVTFECALVRHHISLAFTVVTCRASCTRHVWWVRINFRFVTTCNRQPEDNGVGLGRHQWRCQLQL